MSGPRAAGASQDSPRPASLRGQFGIERALELSTSSVLAERRRGFARLSAIGSPRALEFLNAALLKMLPRPDRGQELKALIQALAPHARDADTRVTLLRTLLGSVGAEGVAIDPSLRKMAALAIALQRDDASLKALQRALAADTESAQFAKAALLAHRPRDPKLLWAGFGSPVAAELLGDLGDPAALPTLHRWLQQGDLQLQDAALLAKCKLGDRGTGAVASQWLTQAPGLARREAASRVLVCSKHPRAGAAIADLLSDTQLRDAALELLLASPQLAQLAVLSKVAQSDAPRRQRVFEILGRSREPAVVAYLATQLAEPQLGGHASHALAQSETSGARREVEAALLNDRTRRAAARAAVLRTIRWQEQYQNLIGVLEALNASRNPFDISVGAWGLAALVPHKARELFDSKDAIRLISVARTALIQDHAFFSAAAVRLLRTAQPISASVLSVALLEPHAADRIPTSRLIELSSGNSQSAPLAAYILAGRDEPSQRQTLLGLLASSNPVLRAHATLGLGESAVPSASGLLARMYDEDSAWQVRWGALAALSKHHHALTARTLRQAAQIEPHDEVRNLARHLLAGKSIDVTARGNDSRLLVLDSPGPHGSTRQPPGAHVALSPALALPLWAEPDGTLPVLGIAATAHDTAIAAFTDLPEASSPSPATASHD